MSEHNNAISFELGDVAKKLLMAFGSFMATVMLALFIKHFFRNNVGFAIAMLAVLFFSLSMAVRFARTRIKEYLKGYGWFIIPSALTAILVIASLKPLVFVMLFLLQALTCIFFKELKNNARVGIEFSTLITILASFVYGGKVAALLGPLAVLTEYALTARFSYFTPVTTMAYALIGFFAGNFSGLGITAVGIAAAVIYNIITSVVIVSFMGGHLEKCLRFAFTNIPINIMLFAAVAPKLQSILT